jgi:hypothetical protein
MRRVLVILLVVVVLVPALISAAQLALRRTLVDDLAATGCSGAAVEKQFVRSQRILVVGVNECVDESGRALPAAAALERVAAAVWSTPAAPFDGISATIYRTRDSAAVEHGAFSRTELRDRWGERASYLDWTVPDLAYGGWLIYLALPAMLLAAVAPVVLGVFAARRGVFVFFWRA